MIRTLIIFLISLLPSWHLMAQTLSPQVIAAGGRNFKNSTASISYTIGESVTPTLTAGGTRLRQGFHQPFQLKLNLKAYLQGYYNTGSGQMNDVLYMEGQYNSASSVTDTITVELHETTSPFALKFSSKTLLYQNGQAIIKGKGHLGQSYYVVIKHRNHLETWSAMPVTLSSNTTFDFTISNNQAYGQNEVAVQNGVYALYSGDLNQDGAVDAFDYVVLDPDIYDGASGYLATDLNGDGSVDVFDYVIIDPNIYNGIGFATP